jgi:hypothetical protein
MNFRLITQVGAVPLCGARHLSSTRPWTASYSSTVRSYARRSRSTATEGLGQAVHGEMVPGHQPRFSAQKKCFERALDSPETSACGRHPFFWARPSNVKKPELARSLGYTIHRYGDTVYYIYIHTCMHTYIHIYMHVSMRMIKTNYYHIYPYDWGITIHEPTIFYGIRYPGTRGFNP